MYYMEDGTRTESRSARAWHLKNIRDNQIILTFAGESIEWEP